MQLWCQESASNLCRSVSYHQSSHRDFCENALHHASRYTDNNPDKYSKLFLSSLHSLVPSEDKGRGQLLVLAQRRG